MVGSFFCIFLEISFLFYNIWKLKPYNSMNTCYCTAPQQAPSFLVLDYWMALIFLVGLKN